MRSQTLSYGYEIFGVCVVWILNILRKPTRRYNQVYVYKERVEYFCASVCMDVRTYGELFALVWFCANYNDDDDNDDGKSCDDDKRQTSSM